MRIGIITAMTSEQEQLAARLSAKKECVNGRYRYIEGVVPGGNEAVLMQCGIGKVNAAVGAVELIHSYRPDCVISTGVAGGIDSSLRVMDVVVGREVVYHDVWCGEGNAYGQVQGLPLKFAGNETLYHSALQIESDTGVHGGLICSGDRFITDREELDAIKRNFPEGLAVDMESASIAQVCHLYGLPFLSFRIISDTSGVENHFSQYTDFWGEMANRSFRVTDSFLKSLPVSL